jgi:hypothetical protein
LLMLKTRKEARTAWVLTHAPGEGAKHLQPSP